jgi:hypothetical protein
MPDWKTVAWTPARRITPNPTDINPPPSAFVFLRERHKYNNFVTAHAYLSLLA